MEFLRNLCNGNGKTERWKLGISKVIQCCCCCRLLYQILGDRTVVKNAPSVLIVCNKHDCGVAKGARLVQSALEKEL